MTYGSAPPESVPPSGAEQFVKETIYKPSGASSEQHRQEPNDRTGTDWISRCIKDAKGTPIPDLAKVMVALRNDPVLMQILAYDQMLQAPILVHPVPAETIPKEFEARPVTDVDVGFIQEWLQHAGLPRISKDIVHQAVDMRAVECAFHV
jgi:hypothetical protein